MSLIEFYPHLRVIGFQKSPVAVIKVAKARLLRKSCVSARSLKAIFSVGLMQVVSIPVLIIAGQSTGLKVGPRLNL